MKNVKKIFAALLAVAMIFGCFAACGFEPKPEELILGSWRDSTGTTGYEFKENGVCKITYADVTIPIINVKYDGSIDGVYTVSKDDEGNMFVVITFTLLAQSITKNYKFTVKDSSLTLVDQSDGSSTVFIAYQGADAQETSGSAN